MLYIKAYMWILENNIDKPICKAGIEKDLKMAAFKVSVM